MNNKSLIPICLTYLAGSVLGYFIVSAWINHNAKSHAEALCHAIQPGMHKDQIFSLARQQDGWIDLTTMNIAHAGTDGWGRNCRCAVGLRGDTVSGVDKPVCSN